MGLKDGNLWRMWYVSGIGWFEGESGLKSEYHIKYSESNDGINWIRSGIVCIDLQADELNISRPTVIKTADKFLMYYSYHGEYRMG